MPKIQNVLSVMIRYNKKLAKSIYGIDPLIRALPYLTMSDFVQIQSAKLYDEKGIMEVYSSDLMPIFRKLEGNPSDPNDKRFLHSDGSIHYTMGVLNSLLQNIDLNELKKESSKLI
jgi:hypothetical protein